MWLPCGKQFLISRKISVGSRAVDGPLYVAMRNPAVLRRFYVQKQ